VRCCHRSRGRRNRTLPTTQPHLTDNNNNNNNNDDDDDDDDDDDNLYSAVASEDAKALNETCTVTGIFKISKRGTRALSKIKIPYFSHVCLFIEREF